MKILHILKSIATPAPPLHVEVAKALDEDVRYYNRIGWVLFKNGDPFPHPVPERTKSVELAMGALEEYCRKNKLIIKMDHQNSHPRFNMRWYVAIYNPATVSNPTDIKSGQNNSLPLAICEAIKQHSEGAR